MLRGDRRHGHSGFSHRDASFGWGIRFGALFLSDQDRIVSCGVFRSYCMLHVRLSGAVPSALSYDVLSVNPNIWYRASSPKRKGETDLD
eukprot:7390492-Prymnesium_polylepis.2